MNDVVLKLEHVGRRFSQAGETLDVLDDIGFELHKGEIVALLGQSGSGKSTLLHIAGLLEPPTSGTVIVNGIDCGKARDRVRTEIRRKEIGFIYQYHHLLPEFSALENVMMPLLIAGMRNKPAIARAEYLLEQMGLSHRLKHRPAKLSGGEQQRVAVARALANEPIILLADEPTGNLDSKTADMVFDQFLSLVKDQKVAALVATHNTELAARMDRTVHVRNSHLE